jgi:hypothetical protein
MRSRAAKLTLGAVALIVFVAAAYFVFHSEQQTADLRARVRAFDLRARETADLLVDLRVAQQAYVAAGQGVAFWIPKVTATSAAAVQAVASLSESAASSAAQSSLRNAAASLADFAAADARARDYLKSGPDLMAADVVFTDGAQTAAAAARQVEAARVAEHQDADASEAAIRKQEAIELAAAGATGLLVILLLAMARAAEPEAQQVVVAGLGLDAPGRDVRPDRDTVPERPAEEPPRSAPRNASPLLTAAAQVCTEFGRVRDFDDLAGLLGRAADVMEASGLVVWLGNTAGADLRPVLSHGYPPQTIARMPSVPKSANNAAAAAYRGGALQIVLSRPGSAAGAIVAPLLVADGCIGALSVEIRGGGETSDGIQALVGIFAAQLAGVLAGSVADASASDAPAVPESKVAAGG